MRARLTLLALAEDALQSRCPSIRRVARRRLVRFQRRIEPWAKDLRPADGRLKD